MTIKWAWILRLWLPIAVALTALSVIVYTAVQQDLRLSADDPQIQMSEDAATALAEGRQVATVLSPGNVDASTSLAPFMIVLDEAGRPISASVQLNGQIPLPPSGVFDYARMHHQDRFTWQPAQGVRLATVVTYYSGQDRSGFVLVGRSMREVERREDLVRNIVFVGMIGTLGATLMVAGVVSYLRAE